jgi:glucose/arabinose dehydrogenase
MISFITMKKQLLAILLIAGSFVSTAQTIDTIGNTVVQISVALDSSHFQNGYMSSPWDLHWGPDLKLWYTNNRTLCTYDPATHLVDTILEIPSGYIMAVATHINFFNYPYVYLTIDTASYYGVGNNIKVYSYEYSLTGDSLLNPQLLLEWNHPGEHSGGRIIYGQNDKLYISTAEYWIGNDTLFNNSGKVLRVNPDGTVPSDNPRADYTYTYGHRNPQGIVQVPNGNLFVSEYGQQWDELNLLEENKYFGWITYDGITCLNNQDSCDYYDSTAVFPIDVAMNPPSGIDYYNHPAIPEFTGLVQAVTGAIKQGLIVYTMNADYDSVVAKNYYLTQQFGRVRDVCAASDGSVYFIAGDRSVPKIMRVQNPLFDVVYEAGEPSFTFYPNPTTDKIFYRVHSGNQGVITIYDISGKIITSVNASGDRGEIDTGYFPAGSYTISYKDKDGKVTSNRMVKLK